MPSAAGPVRPISSPSTSTWITACSGPGSRQACVVSEPSLQPSTSTTSAARSAALPRRVPNEPAAPAASGPVSSTAPLPLIEVATGMRAAADSARTASEAPPCVTPPPARISGRSAAASSAAARPSSSGAGAGRKRG